MTCQAYLPLAKAACRSRNLPLSSLWLLHGCGVAWHVIQLALHGLQMDGNVTNVVKESSTMPSHQLEGKPLMELGYLRLMDLMTPNRLNSWVRSLLDVVADADTRRMILLAQVMVGSGQNLRYPRTTRWLTLRLGMVNHHIDTDFNMENPHLTHTGILHHSTHQWDRLNHLHLLRTQPWRDWRRLWQKMMMSLGTTARVQPKAFAGVVALLLHRLNGSMMLQIFVPTTSSARKCKSGCCKYPRIWPNGKQHSVCTMPCREKPNKSWSTPRWKRSTRTMVWR